MKEQINKMGLKIYYVFFVIILFFSLSGCGGGGGCACVPPPTLQPKASLSADKSSGFSPLTVTFTIGYIDPDSYVDIDPDKYPGSYLLDYGDTTKSSGAIISKTTMQVQHVYDCLFSTCTYTANLRMQDVSDMIGFTNVIINVSVSTSPKTFPISKF